MKIIIQLPERVYSFEAFEEALRDFVESWYGGGEWVTVTKND